MRFLIYSDVHFCENSSIVRSMGDKYSTRLENLIKSLNWAEDQAIKNHCDEVICLGDFFNKPDLNSRELTALQEICWSAYPHTFLVGNHDACDKSLFYNSVTALRNNGFKIVTSPESRYVDDMQLLFLPYITEESRKQIKTYSNNFDPSKLYVFSHNDIKGLQYGMFESKEGFDLSDIEDSCRIFLNGHLHNGDMICKNGINVGNLTGQNFSEDASKYSHNVVILDTDQNTVDFIENPYALNFYKLDYTSTNDIDYSFELKRNAVISIKCKASQVNYIRGAIKSSQDGIVEARVAAVPDQIDSIEDTASIITTNDHKERFIQFCLTTLVPSDILNEELQEVCK